LLVVEEGKLVEVVGKGMDLYDGGVKLEVVVAVVVGNCCFVGGGDDDKVVVVDF